MDERSETRADVDADVDSVDARVRTAHRCLYEYASISAGSTWIVRLSAWRLPPTCDPAAGGFSHARSMVVQPRLVKRARELTDHDQLGTSG
jgi:hypothetical protein